MSAYLHLAIYVALTRPTLGHSAAARVAGVLQRDISTANIMLVDEKLKQHVNFTGFLHDFDYSSMSKYAPEGDLSKCKASVLTRTVFADEDNGALKERTVSLLLHTIETY